MSLGVNTDLSGSALTSLSRIQQSLSQTTSQLSSGNRITNASVDPAGLAIYNNLETQSQGADTANQNITDASDAVNVAQGATSTIQSSLSTINNLAIEANNGFNSPSDNAALQAQANQLVQGINQVAGETNFNGTELLNGAGVGLPIFRRREIVPTNLARIYFRFGISEGAQEGGIYVRQFSVQIANDHAERVGFGQAAESLGGLG